jgi:hypothetical protein
VIRIVLDTNVIDSEFSLALPRDELTVSSRMAISRHLERVQSRIAEGLA